MEPRRLLLVRPLINVESNSPFFLPLGLLCLAAAARQSRHAVDLIDFEFLHRSRKAYRANEPTDSFAQPIVDARPDVVGITVLADTLPTALVLGRALKAASPEIKVVLGGPGTFGMIPSLKREFANSIDFICAGEGEAALVQLLDCDLSAATQEVPGLVRADGEEQLPPAYVPAPFVDLDSLPTPAYDLVEMKEYLELASPRVFDLYVGTGCTYACTFCTTAPFWNRTFRAKSPARILEEMKNLHAKYGIEQFNFVHDNFANNKIYLTDFLDYFEAHNTKFSWGCAVRPDNVNRATLQRMQRAGCEFVFCGTDSGSPSILRAMKKATSTQRSYRLFEDTRATGIQLETNTIIGYPYETDDGLEASLEIVFDAIAFGARTADVSVLQPLPGSTVALTHQKDIRLVDSNLLGTYIPDEALELIRNRLDLFCGFGYIHRNNRSYEECIRIAQLVRFFTRHYVRSILFLKKALNVRYLDVFDRLARTHVESLSDTFPEVACSFVKGLSAKPLFEDVLEFDLATERLRKVDVSAEVGNVYTAPPRLEPGPLYTWFDASYPVHQVFAARTDISVVNPCSTPITYVLSSVRNIEEIITVALHGWQRLLWRDFEQHYSNLGNDGLRAVGMHYLATERPHLESDDIEMVVQRTITTFEQLTGTRAM